MRIGVREDDDERLARLAGTLADAGFFVRSGTPDDLAGGSLLILDVGIAELPELLGRLSWSASTGRLRLDPAAHAVRVGDRMEALTPTEFRLLAALAERPGECLRRYELRAAGWSKDAIVHDNTLDAYMARLRRKLRRLGADAQISTTRRVGYSLRRPVS
jgi:Transcriptional regulatory protein, C terminal